MTKKQQVKDYLQNRNGTKQDIVKHTGLTYKEVSQALNDLISGGGAFKVDMRGSRAVYSLQNNRKPKGLPMQYKPPFEEMTPDKYDLWQGRNLAMLAR